jgi:hypothetical protein
MNKSVVLGGGEVFPPPLAAEMLKKALCTFGQVILAVV